MKPHSNPELLSVAAAAKALGVTRQRVYALAWEGKLASLREHRHTYILASAVRERLAAEEGS